jgi:hypothetical protein
MLNATTGLEQVGDLAVAHASLIRARHTRVPRRVGGVACPADTSSGPIHHRWLPERRTFLNRHGFEVTGYAQRHRAQVVSPAIDFP